LVNEEVTIHGKEVREQFLDEKLIVIKIVEENFPWFTIVANLKATGEPPKDLKPTKKKKFFLEAKRYVWDDAHLFKIGADNLLRRCVTRQEATSMLWHCHNSPYGGHFNGEKTVAKVLQSGFFWSTLFKDAYAHVEGCNKCQRIGNISRRHEMPMQSMLEVKVFDC